MKVWVIIENSANEYGFRDVYPIVYLSEETARHDFKLKADSLRKLADEYDMEIEESKDNVEVYKMGYYDENHECISIFETEAKN